MSKKLGLVLGGGSARGYAHIGVLKVLEREGIPIDLIAGTSMGSLIGAHYACGFHPSELEEMALATKKRHIASLSFSKKALLSTRRIRKILDRGIGDATFQDLAIPLSVVTMDILKGEEVIISTGPVKEAVLSSISIPGVFPPRRMNDKLLIDGGHINQVPVSVAKNMGADFVIAVDIGFVAKKRGQYRNAVQIAIRAIEIMARKLMAIEEANADIVIKPDVESESVMAYHRAAYFIQAGEEATKAALPMIRAKINL